MYLHIQFERDIIDIIPPLIKAKNIEIVIHVCDNNKSTWTSMANSSLPILAYRTLHFLHTDNVLNSRPAKFHEGLILKFWGHVLFKAVTHVILLHNHVLFKIGVDNIF